MLTSTIHNTTHNPSKLYQSVISGFFSYYTNTNTNTLMDAVNNNIALVDPLAMGIIGPNVRQFLFCKNDFVTKMADSSGCECKMHSASGVGLRPRDQGLCCRTPLAGLCPRPPL